MISKKQLKKISTLEEIAKNIVNIVNDIWDEFTLDEKMQVLTYFGFEMVFKKVDGNKKYKSIK